jgi:hypothetical protein
VSHAHVQDAIPGQRVDNKALHAAFMRRLEIEGYFTDAIAVIGLMAGAADIWMALTRVCH